MEVYFCAEDGALNAWSLDIFYGVFTRVLFGLLGITITGAFIRRALGLLGIHLA
jgi:hypothetical protein